MYFGAYHFLLILIVCFQYSLGQSYNVAVIELPVNLDDSQPAEVILADNAANYLSVIENVTQNQALDLIIFPESTLTPYFAYTDAAAQLPKSSDTVLCNSTEEVYLSFLKEISCAAISHKTTIVINFTEKDVCKDGKNGCLVPGATFYNTNVAFGTDGKIIARYRKWNLFGEYGKSKPTQLDLPVLIIKNTTFGMMTCFDIQFGTPGFNLVKDKGVQNVIFPLNWISELPYLTALQTEQMWAQEFNVVLLAAGSSFPTSGAGGSGIFYGNQGPLESIIQSKSGRQVIIQSVPTDMQFQLNNSHEVQDVETIDSLAASMDDFFMLIDPSIPEHNSIVMDVSEGTMNSTVCHGEGDNKLCCNFNISVSMTDNVTKENFDFYTYHLVAFNGVRTYSRLYYGGVETCGVLACLNRSVASCGQRFQNYSNIVWPLTLNEISIVGNFDKSDERVQYPTTLLSSIRPLPVREYAWDKEEVSLKSVRKLNLQNPQTRLLTFGIFGRDFARDWDPIRNNANENFAPKIYLASLFLLIICVTSY